MKEVKGADGPEGTSTPPSALRDNGLPLDPWVMPIAAVVPPETKRGDSIAAVTVARPTHPAFLPQGSAGPPEFSRPALALAQPVSDGSGLEDSEPRVTALSDEGTFVSLASHAVNGGSSFQASAGISAHSAAFENGRLPAASPHPAKAPPSPDEPALVAAEPHSVALDPRGNEPGSGNGSISPMQISSVATRAIAHPSEVSKPHESMRSILSKAPPEALQPQRPDGFVSPPGAESRPVSDSFNPSIASIHGSGFSGHREAVGASNNLFTQLDAAPDLDGLQSRSTRHEVSVGYRDESYGWMEIRTQADSGRMSAVLQTSSTEAHRALSAEAPAIGQYLSGQDIALHSLSVHQGLSESGAHSNAGAQSGHSSQPQTQSQSGSPASASSRGTPLASAELSEDLSGSSLISVRV